MTTPDGANPMGSSNFLKTERKGVTKVVQPSLVRIAPEVLAVLKKAVIVDDSKIHLAERIDRKIYDKTKKVLDLLGCKWNRSSGMHCFEGGNAGDLLEEAIANEAVVDFKKTFQFFETPEAIARKMVDIATLKPNERVLEPSAGLGAIAHVAREIVRVENVVCYEADPQRRLALIKDGFTVRGHAEAGNDFCDFLGVDPKRIVDIDVVLMNPPFARGQDIAHVLHAFNFLRPGGRLVAITSPGWTFRQERKYQEFREFVEQHMFHQEALPAGTFKASGTNASAILLGLEPDKIGSLANTSLNYQIRRQAMPDKSENMTEVSLEEASEALSDEEDFEDFEEESDESREESSSPSNSDSSTPNSEDSSSKVLAQTREITKPTQLKYEAGEEPYDPKLCTINIAIQLQPDDGHENGRSVLIGIRSHGDTPVLQFCRLDEIELPAQILQMINNHAEQFPERERLRTERKKVAEEAETAKQAQKEKDAEAKTKGKGKSKDKDKGKNSGSSKTPTKPPTPSASSPKTEVVKTSDFKHTPTTNAEQLFLFGSLTL
jgi:predicted RNA methylase